MEVSMTRKAKYIMMFSLLAAGLGVATIALMTRSSPVGASVQPQVPPVTLGFPEYGGTGCPAGTARAVLSPDATTLSILFDQYVAEAPRGQSFDRKSCNFAVPLNIPSGWAVSLISADWRGFIRLPPRARGTFRAETFFAGQTGPVLQQSYVGATSRNILVQQDVVAVTWSRCGDQVTARVNSSAVVEKQRSGDPDALLAVDTADIQAGLLFRLRWRRC
jgi:hypothetical protein